MLIVKGETLLERYFDDLPDNYFLSASDTGYVNDEICLAWARHFVQYSRPSDPSEKRLLFFDGFDSHCTQEFLQILGDHGNPLSPAISYISFFTTTRRWLLPAVQALARGGC